MYLLAGNGCLTTCTSVFVPVCVHRWQSTKAKLAVIFAVLLLVVVIFLLACFAGGRQCTKRSS